MSTEKSKFGASLRAGIIILALLHFIIPVALPVVGKTIKDIDQSMIDWVMQLYRNTTPSADIPHFTVLDIDEDTYISWGEPLITPRDKLQKLIQFAVERKPYFIMVDVELHRPSEHDNELLQYLREYAKKCHSPEEIFCPHIFLVPKLQQKETQGKFFWKQRKSIGDLDELVEQSPFLHWVAPLFENESSDYGNLRYWHLKIEVEDEKNVTKTLPSVQLLSNILLSHRKESKQVIADKILQLEIHQMNGEELESAHGRQKSERIHQRVIYTIPWKLEDKEGYPVIGEGKRLLVKYPAHLVFDGSLNHLPKDKNVEHGIVVIGGSYLEGRDMYPTVLGSMPGYFVLINSIISLERFGELEEVSKLGTLAIELILIVIVGGILSWYNSFKIIMTITLLITFIIIPVSILLFKFGVWLEFFMPLVGIIIHQFYDYVGDLQEKLRRLQKEFQKLQEKCHMIEKQGESCKKEDV